MKDAVLYGYLNRLNAMTNENEKFNDKQTVCPAEFEKMYQYLTSGSVRQTSDKLFAATTEELAQSYKPDDYSV